MKAGNLNFTIAGKELLTVTVNGRGYLDECGLFTKSYKEAVKFHTRHEAKGFINMKFPEAK